MPLPKSDILKLYKSSLTYINSLKYSDKDYLRQRIKREFRLPISQDQQEYYYKKGLSLLERSKLA